MQIVFIHSAQDPKVGLDFLKLPVEGRKALYFGKWYPVFTNQWNENIIYI